MTMRRTILMLLLVSAAGGVGVSFAYQSFRRSQGSFERTVRDLEECRRIEEQLLTLHTKADADPQSHRTLTEVIPSLTDSASKSQLDPRLIVFIEPGTSKPLREGSPYLEQTVHVELENLPLLTLGRFLREIEGSDAGFRVRDVRVSAPRSTEITDERWHVELTLTCFVVAATEPAHRR